MMQKRRSVIITALLFAVLFASSALLHHFNGDENRRFESYTNHLFCQEVAGSTISLHYTLKNPSSFGIEHTPISFGSYTSDTAAVCAASENALSALHSFERRRLSKENRLTYDILESYLESSRQLAPYTLYDEPLAPLTGAQAQLPVLLSEYRFYSRSDIETYLKLLTKTPEYFHSILEFERAKSESGLFMAAYSAEDIIQECQAFIDMADQNYLYSSFRERLDATDLTEEEKNAYIETNSAYIKDYVFPAYSELKDGLSALRDTGKNSNGLCHLPDGRKYYELTAASETGSSRTIPELQQLTQQQMIADLTDMQKILTPSSGVSSVSSDLFKSQGTILADRDPASILAELKGRLKSNFPDPPKVSTQIKYVQKSMEDYLSPAFYMIPAIDNSSENVIYINQGHLPDDLSLFTTLAHEGYPGHLYQTTYYAGTDPDPIRSLLNFGGYTEGWATYTEMMSYYYAPLSKEQATLMQKNNSVILGLYALADMGIHYEGWTLLETISFFRSYGITDTDSIETIYELIIADPANYLKYYIGYVEFLELKKDALKEWGDDFSQKRFHTAVLDIGPAPFELIHNYILNDK